MKTVVAMIVLSRCRRRPYERRGRQHSALSCGQMGFADRDGIAAGFFWVDLSAFCFITLPVCSSIV